MPIVNLTINGKKVQAEAGQTILQASRAAGFDIPTLCNHPALKPESICRICVVEVERQRVLQPACTFPVAEGLVIQTDSERVATARRTILQLIFSQRLHYCMFCAESGASEDSECEFQRLAYRYQLSSWQFAPNSLRRWPVDASRTHFVMDHNRCIMCRRCVKACDEIVANHTLSIRGRGSRTMIIADNDVPFAESSCVSCGTCLQVCPSGALIDRRSAYMGRGAAMERTATTCLACSVGCGIVGVTRSNLLHRIEGDWNAANGGLVCVDGRFHVLDQHNKRITSPFVRRDGAMVESTWDDALTIVAERMQRAKAVAGLASARSTSETLSAFKRFFSDVVKSKQIGLLNGAAPPPDLGTPASLRDLPIADCVVIVGGDPWSTHKVLGYLTRRAVEKGALLLVVADAPTGLDSSARLLLKRAEIGQVVGVVQSAQRPVVIYAAGLPQDVYDVLKSLPTKARFLPLVEGANAAGAAKLGIGAKAVHGDVLYVFAGDDMPGEQALPKSGFTVVQAAYQSAWTEQADVVLPAQVWSEREGQVTNIEGQTRPVMAFTHGPAGIPADHVAMGMLTIQMGKPAPAAERAAVAK